MFYIRENEKLSRNLLVYSTVLDERHVLRPVDGAKIPCIASHFSEIFSDGHWLFRMTNAENQTLILIFLDILVPFSLQFSA